MLSDLPPNVLWTIFEKLEDVKSCVNTWICCSSIFHLYTPSEFWQQMNRVFYGVDNLGGKCCHPVEYWKNTFWSNYAKRNGCAFCCKHSKKATGSFVNIDTLNIFVCTHCQQNIGTRFVHKECVDTWQLQMARRKSGYHPRCMFKSYIGDNVLAWCHRYNSKCVRCLKNIRNERCGSFCCGNCCNCKYHKSYYEQFCNAEAFFVLSVDLQVISQDITDVRKLFSASCSTKKKQMVLRNMVMV